MLFKGIFLNFLQGSFPKLWHQFHGYSKYLQKDLGIDFANVHRRNRERHNAAIVEGTFCLWKVDQIGGEFEHQHRLCHALFFLGEFDRHWHDCIFWDRGSIPLRLNIRFDYEVFPCVDFVWRIHKESCRTVDNGKKRARWFEIQKGWQNYGTKVRHKTWSQNQYIFLIGLQPGICWKWKQFSRNHDGRSCGKRREAFETNPEYNHKSNSKNHVTKWYSIIVIVVFTMIVYRFTGKLRTKILTA